MIDDKVLFEHPIFQSEMESEEDFHTMESKLEAAGIKFPSFVTFDKQKPARTIRWAKETGEYTVDDFEDNETKSWDKLEDAYDYVQKELLEDVIFDASVKEAPGNREALGDSFFVPSEPGFSRLLMSQNVDDRVLEVNHFYRFLCASKDWLGDQDNPVKAYHFIANHPAFWHRYDAERPNDWNFFGGHRHLDVMPVINDAGKMVVMLEHGRTVEGSWTTHYHDPRLDVWGSSFDDAYIQMAKKVHKFYSLDGEERPDIDYPPQPWEVEISKRLEESQEQLRKNKEAEGKEGQ